MTVTRLAHLGWANLLIATILLILGGSADTNIFYSLGVTTFNFKGTVALCFSLISLLIIKAVSIYYREHLYEMKRDTEIRSSLPYLRTLILGLLILLVCGSTSRYCATELNKMAVEKVNNELVSSLSQISSGTSNGVVFDEPTTVEIENISFYKSIQFWTNLVFQFLLALLVTVTSGIIYAYWEINLNVCIKRRAQSRSREKALRAIAKYQSVFKKRKRLIKSYSELTGLINVEESNNANYGLK